MNDSGSPLIALSEALATAVARVAPSVVSIDAGRRDASGIVWDAHHIVTADHTIDDEDAIDVVVSPDSPPRRLTIVGRDEATDIALLRSDDLFPSPIARAPAEPRPGSLALALARDDDGDPAASFGIVSAIAGPWRTWRGGEIERYLRADLTVGPGFSGGPLVDVTGALLGMNTWGLSRRHALVVPLVTLDRVVAQLAGGGHAVHPYIGVALQAVRLPEALRAARTLAQHGGAIVLDVAAGGPAERAGVAIGDVVIALDAQTIEDADDLQRALAHVPIESTPSLRVLRGGELRHIAITIGERPQATGARHAR